LYCAQVHKLLLVLIGYHNIPEYCPTLVEGCIDQSKTIRVLGPYTS